MSHAVVYRNPECLREKSSHINLICIRAAFEILILYLDNSPSFSIIKFSSSHEVPNSIFICSYNMLYSVSLSGPRVYLRHK